VPTFAVIISRRTEADSPPPARDVLEQLAIGLTDHGAMVSEVSDGSDWSVLLSVDADTIQDAPPRAHALLDAALARVGGDGSATYAIEAMTVAEQQRILAEQDD